MNTQFFNLGEQKPAEGRRPWLIRAAAAAAALVIALALIAKFGAKPKSPAPVVKREAFDLQVLSVQEGGIPYGFPSDLPLEKGLAGYELQQSTANLDYIMKRASYLVAFQTPWSKDEAVKKYEEYLKKQGYEKPTHLPGGENAIALQSTKRDGYLTVTITEMPPSGGASGGETSMRRITLSYQEAFSIR